MFALICCLLAVSSTAFGRSTYGSYSSAPLTQLSSVNVMRDLTSQLPQSGYGQQQQLLQQQPQSTFLSGLTQTVQQDAPVQRSTYGSSYGAQSFPQKQQQQFLQADQTFSLPQTYSRPQVQLQSRMIPSPQQLLFDQQQQLQQNIQQSQIITEADVICRGQRAETVIPLDNARRFVVCLDDGKGFLQECPKGLFYHSESRRCERKLGPLENPCSSQPCLNGGQCVQTDVSSHQCQCAPGFDGPTCELDATVCQTQQPCGQSPDTKCQSFRWGAALQHICILQNGRAYGLTASQALPNPCQGVDGTQPLAFSDKGFIMCDGESMFVESCPGGTVWDDLNKACVWPDMQGVIGTFADQLPKSQGYGGYGQQNTYGSVQRPLNGQYGGQSQLDQTKLISQYGQQSPMKSFSTQLFAQQKPMQVLQSQQLQQDQVSSGYGSQQMQFPQQQQDLISSGYGSQQQIQLPQQQIQLPQQQIQLPQQQQVQFPQQRDLISSGYGSQQQIQLPQKQDLISSGFGTQQQVQLPQQRDQIASGYGSQQIQFPQKQDLISSGFGTQQQIQLPQQQDLISSGYGSQQQIQLPQQQIQLPQVQIQLPQQRDQVSSGYGSQQQIQLPQQQQQDQIRFSQLQQDQIQIPQQQQQQMIKPQTWQQPIQRQQEMRSVQSGY